MVQPSSSTTTWQTVLRQGYIEPLLPPPIIQSIRTVDATIYESVGIPEASITLLVTLFLAWMLLHIMGWFMSTSSSNSSQRRRAIKVKPKSNHDDASQLQQQPQYDATVLLTGPRHGGKTRLFYQFVQYESTTTTTTMNTNTNTTDDAAVNKRMVYKLG